MGDIYSVLRQLAGALAQLQSLGIIHTDLKPGNIMLVNDSKPLTVKIIDFGLACFESRVKVGSNAGTRWFKAPELLLGLPFTGAIDVWALGCVAVKMFTGYHLYPGRSIYQMLKFISETQGPFPDHMLDFGKKKKTVFHQRELLDTQDKYHGETGGTQSNRFKSQDDLRQVRDQYSILRPG
ncbi:Homeodomain-interacting protein kinase 2 [Merluccius polli]|uniref:Homeodomain-interacting protein kinase 2 n=1 Tax=Merluccius polli TaxID=89951 RepID=A0AA47N7E5_MERPO|nr:Homeodomain-interacting protein kinase 2 [Merluccius polli]